MFIFSVYCVVFLLCFQSVSFSQCCLCFWIVKSLLSVRLSLMFIDIANFGVFQERFKKFDKHILVKISSVIAPFFPEQEEIIKNIMFIRLKKDCLILIIFYIHFKQILTIKAEIITTGRSFFFFLFFYQIFNSFMTTCTSNP